MVRDTFDVMKELEQFSAQEAAARRDAIRDIDTRLTGTMQMRAGGFAVHIDREVSFNRDTDGTWLVNIFRTDPEATALIAHDACDAVSAALEIHDASTCAFLDHFAHMLANPAGQVVTMGTPDEAEGAA